MFSRANRVCRATNRYQGSVYTLSVCSSLRTRCWDEFMSCVLRRTLTKLRRNPRARILCWFYAAVKKTAPSSREAIGPEVPDGCPLSRGAMGQKFQMHACSWCLLVLACVPRMRCAVLCLLCNIQVAIPKSDVNCLLLLTLNSFTLILGCVCVRICGRGRGHGRWRISAWVWSWACWVWARAGVWAFGSKFSFFIVFLFSACEFFLFLEIYN